jgi:hypothetical protein
MHIAGSPTTFGFPGMQVKPLLPSRKITLLPCASVSMIRADSEMSSGPADIARAILSCVVSPAIAGIPLCEAFDSARSTNLIPIIRNRAIAAMALAKNLRLELWHLICELLSLLPLRSSAPDVAESAFQRLFAAFEAMSGIDCITSLQWSPSLEKRRDRGRDLEHQRIVRMDFDFCVGL